MTKEETILITPQGYLALETELNDLKLNKEMMHRSLNTNFSGGEKKKNEILQMLVLNPKLAILDETDSGLDVDAIKTVSKGIEMFKNDKNIMDIARANSYEDLVSTFGKNYFKKLQKCRV